MHLKCNKDKDADVWTEALTALLDVYSNKKLVDFDINRQYKDRVDIRVSNMIMAELESKFSTKTLIASELQKACHGFHRVREIPWRQRYSVLHKRAYKLQN